MVEANQSAHQLDDHILLYFPHNVLIDWKDKSRRGKPWVGNVFSKNGIGFDQYFKQNKVLLLRPPKLDMAQPGFVSEFCKIMQYGLHKANIVYPYEAIHKLISQKVDVFNLIGRKVAIPVGDIYVQA